MVGDAFHYRTVGDKSQETGTQFATHSNIPVCTLMSNEIAGMPGSVAGNATVCRWAIPGQIPAADVGLFALTAVRACVRPAVGRAFARNTDYHAQQFAAVGMFP